MKAWMLRLVAMLGLVAAAGANPAAVPAERSPMKDWLERNYGRIETDLKTLDLKKVKVVFIGDSITSDWAGWHGKDVWKSHFGDPDGPLYGLNLGVGGDRTQHLLYRIRGKADGGMGHLDPEDLSPKVIVLMIGINNTCGGGTNADIAEGIMAVTRALLTKKPGARSVPSCRRPMTARTPSRSSRSTGSSGT